MAAATVICVVFILFSSANSQTAELRQYINKTLPNQGICKSQVSNSLKAFYEAYKDCIVIIGNLTLALLERTTNKTFKNISFPNLREVTGYFVVYRVNGLNSLGQLFPNLARIRGETLMNNYGLTVHDMSTLKEIGLYGLLRIDRGGVIIWGVPQACFVDTINWTSIAPKSRHVINIQDRKAKCTFNCTCSTDPITNRCWNNKKCQVHLEGPDADKCNDLCLGCRKTNGNVCSLCRYFTYNGQCLTKCPAKTILLPSCQYCITDTECNNLGGWVWNNTCIFECPIGYLKKVTKKGTTCDICDDCKKVCEGQILLTTNAIQAVEPCVYINGSLEIHIRVTPEAMEELRKYLRRIEEIQDYLLIYGSMTITSLDFLPSLRSIKGRTLKNNRYSFILYDMTKLKTLFTTKVTKKLKIGQGTMRVYNNPTLCMSEIEKIKNLFPVTPTDIDIPQGVNGYSGDCEEASVDLQIRIINETSAVIMFSTIPDPDAHYSVLYVRIPFDAPQNLVPETCSDSEWYVVNSVTEFGHQAGIVELTSLSPASTYAICVETYDPIHRRLARSSITNFTTPIGIPEPPFIIELSALKTGHVFIKWTNHRNYRKHISHYELDVSLIEIYESDVAIKDQCKHMQLFKGDHTRHSVVMTPPPEYKNGCKSTCDTFTAVVSGANIEEFFDVCSTMDCNIEEQTIMRNSSIGKFVQALVLNLKNISEHKVDGLAPFRDYRFRLRACTDFKCSRSARAVIRTLPFESADVAEITHVHANETGHVSVAWSPPNVTNGPVLSYLLEILPNIEGQSKLILPQAWCVLANKTEHTAKLIKAKKYSVRVCTRSMASDGVCSEWKSVEVVIEIRVINRWWIGLIFGIMLYIVSIVMGYKIKRKVVESIDLEPIVNSESSMRNESEPPSKLVTDCEPIMYSIPLRDTRL